MPTATSSGASPRTPASRRSRSCAKASRRPSCVSRSTPMLKRSIIFVHRWLGVALCLFFLLWFPSGIGMMYWDFPSVKAADRLERSPALDPSTIRLSPAEAYAHRGAVAAAVAGAAEHLRRPSDLSISHRARREPGLRRHRRAADGRDERSRRPHRCVVGRTTGRRGPARDARRRRSVDGSGDRFACDPTLLKYSWPNGEQVYVSPASGEVVQYTTAASRLGAYLGPIPHWIYFTPLRKHQLAWNRLITWSSGIGTIAAAARPRRRRLDVFTGESATATTGRRPGFRIAGRSGGTWCSA